MLKRNDTETTETETTSTETTTEVAKVETKQVTAVKNMSATSFLNNAEEEGFEGLELNKSSFTSVVLDSGQFCNSETEEELVITDESGKEFNCSKEILINLVSTRTKKMINIFEAGAGKDDAGELHVVYSGEETNHRGENIAEILALAEEDGCEVHTSLYLEAVGSVLEKPAKGKEIDYDNILDVVSLSIPPMSRAKLSGAITIYNSRHRKNPIKSPSEAIILCSVGKKRPSKKGSYFPWSFKCIAKVENY